MHLFHDWWAPLQFCSHHCQVGHSIVEHGMSQAPNKYQKSLSREKLLVESQHRSLTDQVPLVPMVGDRNQQRCTGCHSVTFPINWSSTSWSCHWRGNCLPLPCSKFTRRAGGTCARVCIWQLQRGKKNGKDKLRRCERLILWYRINTYPSPDKVLLNLQELFSFRCECWTSSGLSVAP